jgi:hypothetical protein
MKGFGALQGAPFLLLRPRIAESPRMKLGFQAKSRARLASPQPRPTSPVNGAGGKTGCQDYADAPDLFRTPPNFFIPPPDFLRHG